MYYIQCVPAQNIDKLKQKQYFDRVKTTEWQ